MLKPFDTLVAGQSLLLAAMNEDEAFNHRIPNAWMASVPGHPFWHFCMQHIVAAAAPCTWQPRKRCASHLGLLMRGFSIAISLLAPRLP